MEFVSRNDVRVKAVSRLQARAATFAKFPIVIEYDNRKLVDLTTQTKPYVKFSMVYQDGEQASLGKGVTRRVMGTMVIAVLSREGSGVEDGDAVLDHLWRHMSQTDEMLPLRTYAARFSSSPSMLGWVSQAALVPFWYETL